MPLNLSCDTSQKVAGCKATPLPSGSVFAGPLVFRFVSGDTRATIVQAPGQDPGKANLFDVVSGTTAGDTIWAVSDGRFPEDQVTLSVTEAPPPAATWDALEAGTAVPK